MMEVVSIEGFITPNSEKGGNNFGKLFNDTMICSLIKYFILPRFCNSWKEIMSLEDGIQRCSAVVEYILSQLLRIRFLI